MDLRNLGHTGLRVSAARQLRRLPRRARRSATGGAHPGSARRRDLRHGGAGPGYDLPGFRSGLRLADHVRRRGEHLWTRWGGEYESRGRRVPAGRDRRIDDRRVAPQSRDERARVALRICPPSRVAAHPGREGRTVHHGEYAVAV